MPNGVIKVTAAFLVLTACAATLAVGAGCAAYGEARLSMPPLGNDPVSQWVALLDGRMTGACK